MKISIHVPRVEDDAYPSSSYNVAWNFNPRPPCGGRRRNPMAKKKWERISIHVPRVEDDAYRTME